VICPILKFKKEKWVFVKVEEEKVDFFLHFLHDTAASPHDMATSMSFAYA